MWRETELRIQENALLCDRPILFNNHRVQPSFPLGPAGMRRNNGSVDEMNTKYIPPYCNHNSFSLSYLCAIRSHLVLIPFPSFPYIVWLNQRLQWRFYVPSLFSPCFYLKFSPISEKERYHIITRGVEWNFLGTDFNHIYINTVSVKRLQPNSAKGIQYIKTSISINCQVSQDINIVEIFVDIPTIKTDRTHYLLSIYFNN